MPYTQKELEANEHYTSLKVRDEVKYNKDFNKNLQMFSDRGGSGTLRSEDGTILAYENPQNGETLDHPSQTLSVKIYQRRYRTKEQSKNIFDRSFKEL
tara:strand:+ start:3423 stop:3716 length:294 start_codon:yes stop_codon:yes gene_type:complete